MFRLVLFLLVITISCKRQQGDVPLIAMDSVEKRTEITARREPSFFVLDTNSSASFIGDTLKHVVNVLSFIDSFNRSHKHHSQDTFSVFERTTEGCEVIVLQDTISGYSRIQGTLFGELGKYEFQFYLTGKPNALQLIAAVSNDVRYDRPMYQQGMQYRSSFMEYAIYDQNRLVRVLNEQRIPKIQPEEERRSKETDLRHFFQEYIGQVTIEEAEQKSQSHK